MSDESEVSPDSQESTNQKPIPNWRRVLPKSTDVVDEIYNVPKGVNPELFAQGYWHGKQSTKLIDFRYSFRMGFRKAMIERREEEQLRISKMFCKSTYE